MDGADAYWGTAFLRQFGPLRKTPGGDFLRPSNGRAPKPELCSVADSGRKNRLVQAGGEHAGRVTHFIHPAVEGAAAAQVGIEDDGIQLKKSAGRVMMIVVADGGRSDRLANRVSGA
jgi:hypothetical protein